ncbi:amino acid adenylation domain-containing protein [Nocardia asteroides]|uniref:amino acid adenylation domain-containing protein n=1 Tax=Nocardia asteroides TaxID=1824 RepID=UPI001E49F596|nr:non-ribosomal peptide synthetase [Nocardia asteroides]UGT60610.1 amino acid adenylation domain-containing protein [Nocardia asteroides]
MSPYQRDVLGVAFRLAPEPVAQAVLSFRIDAPLDLPRLQACWERVLRGDDSLRLRFGFADGEFRQWVSDDIAPVRVADLTAEPDPEAAAQRWMWQAVGATDTPEHPARLAAVVDRPDRFFLFISVHHAMMDGYGLNLVIAQLDSAYRMTDVPLDELARPEPVNEYTDRSAATYRTIAEADAAYLGSAEYEQDRETLLATLDGVRPALFPGRSGRPLVVRGHYGTMIPGEFMDRVRATGFSAYAYTAAALAAWLTAVHRTDEVVLGVPMLNRATPETYRTLGHRTNAVPLRVRVDRDQPLAALAAQVAQQIKASKRHQRFPFGDLTKALAPDPTAPPLYDVSYSFTKLPDAAYVQELLAKCAMLNPGPGQEALSIVVAESGSDGSVTLQLLYDTDVFDDHLRIEAALSSFGALLTASLAAPETPIGELPLVGFRTAERIAGWEAGPRAEFPYTTLDRQLLEQVEAGPERIAVLPAEPGAAPLSYGELAAAAAGIAAKLADLGATGDDCVPVVLPRSTAMLTAIHGVVRAGCAYVPLDPGYPASRIETVLRDCGARFVLADAEHDRVYRRLGITRIAPGEARPLPRGVENRSHPAGLAYVIYTSGSTGTPKGVQIEHRSVVNRLTWMQRRYPLTGADIVLQKTPATFDVSVWELFWWAGAGAAVALLEPGGERDPRRIVAAVEQHGVTVLHFVPSMLAAFLDELAADRDAVHRLATLRLVFCSGEELPPALVRRFRTAFAAPRLEPPLLVNLYGPTEGTVDVSYFDVPRRDPVPVVPIGRPIDNIDLLVLDDRGRRLPPGIAGELNIAGIGVGRGYRNRPELTAAAFVADRGVSGRRRYRTGDLARWRADGTLEYLGRFDDQVKIRGNRVTLGEVRNALLGCPGVQAAAVLDERDGHTAHLLGYYVGEATAAGIETWLAERLPRYMVPSRLLRVARIPLTANGKLDRAALAAAAADAGEDAVAPRTPVEAALARVWCELLGIERIGVHDNFFTHGGDSILALSMRTAAERAGLRFQVDAFYQRPTIAGLAEVVGAGSAALAAPVTAALETVPLIDRAALHRAEDAFPATALQLGMLYHSIERAGSITYKDVFRYRLELPWLEAEFRTAFEGLVRRQPALRSSFELSRYSVPLQVVHAEALHRLNVVDLTGNERHVADAAVEEYVRQRRHADYDPAVAPLHEARVFLRDTAGERVVLDFVLSFHHALLDGWSVATAVLELLQDYLHRIGAGGAAIEHEPHPATVLAEYARAETLAAQDEAAREFWRASLAGAEPTALIAQRANQPAGAAPPRARALVPRALAERVAAFAAEHLVPEKAVYLTAHCLSLRVLTGRPDVTTGVVGHGRPDRAGAERVAGLFLNTLPIRLDASATTWLDAVLRIAERERAAYPHRRYPLRAILAEGGPVFETAFNYVNYHLLAPLLGEGAVRIGELDAREDTNFQLLVTVAADPRDGRQWLRVDGDAGLTGDQCETVALTHLRMLAGIVADPYAVAGPATARDVGTLVFEAAALHPDTLALAGDTGGLTYAELVERVEALTCALAGAGIAPGDRVGILMNRRPELVLLVLALARLGVTCVPLDVGYPPVRLNLMIDRAQPHRVIADAEHAAIVAEPALVLDAAAVLAAAAPQATAGASTATGVPPAPALPPVHPDSIAYVLFTSGSTGEPKGVAMPHRGLTALVEWQNRTASGLGQASTLQLAPLSFDVAFQEIFSTLAAGSTLRVSAADLRGDVEELLDTVIADGIERLFLPYVALQAFAEAAVARQRFPHALRVLVSSGEQLRITDEIRALCAAVPGLLLENQYGPTESHVATTFALRGPAAEYPALPPIGRAVAGAAVELLDPALRPVPDGVIGELYLAGRTLARGYHARPALTAQRFVAGPGGGIRYRTGDLGLRLNTGDVVCLGRSDSQVKIRGFRVEPAEVEIAIHALVDRFPGITDAAVVARGYGGIDGALIAFLVGGAAITDQSALRQQLRAVLPAHMVPGRFVWVPELPTTPSGKRDDAALRALAAAAPESTGERREPSDEYERSAVALLAEFAGLREIGPDDDFFAAGGTSIGAMRVVLGLSRRWGAEVPLDAFVGAPTAAGLAALLRSGSVRRTFDPLVPITVPSTERPGRAPVFLVHPIGGNVLCYLALARHLDPDRPVYALQAAGADPGSTPEKTVPAMAAAYLEAVRRVRPQGPYHLAGWSFGGTVALEMARLLPADEVAGVTLLDTMALRKLEHREQIAEEQLIRWFFLELIWYARGEQAVRTEFEPDVHGAEALFDVMLAEAIDSGILPAESSPQAIRRLYDVFHANYVALLEYELTPLDRDIALLRAEGELPPGVDFAHKMVGSMFDSDNNGWAQYAGGAFEVFPVPGDHLHMMVEPHVAEVAARLNEVLAAADRR